MATETKLEGALRRVDIDEAELLIETSSTIHTIHYCVENNLASSRIFKKIIRAVGFFDRTGMLDYAIKNMKSSEHFFLLHKHGCKPTLNTVQLLIEYCKLKNKTIGEACLFLIISSGDCSQNISDAQLKEISDLGFKHIVEKYNHLKKHNNLFSNNNIFTPLPSSTDNIFGEFKHQTYFSNFTLEIKNNS